MVQIAAFLPRNVMVAIVWHAARQALRLGASGGSIGGGSFVQKTLTFLGITSLFDLSDDLFGYDTSDIWNGDANLLEAMVEELEMAVRSGRIHGPSTMVTGNLPSHLTIPLQMVGNRGPFLFTPRARRMTSPAAVARRRRTTTRRRTTSS